MSGKNIESPLAGLTEDTVNEGVLGRDDDSCCFPYRCFVYRPLGNLRFNIDEWYTIGGG